MGWQGQQQSNYNGPPASGMGEQRARGSSDVDSNQRSAAAVGGFGAPTSMQQQQQQKRAPQQPAVGARGVGPSGWSGDDEVDSLHSEMRSLGIGGSDQGGSAGNHSLLSSLQEEQSAAEVERARQQVRQ